MLSPEPDTRRLRWDACYNVRDLGGLPVGDRRTRWGAVIRADNLCRLTRHGRAAMVRYGVRSVLDLRDPDELLLEHDPFSRGDLAGVAYRNVPQLSEEFKARFRDHPSMSAHDADVLTLETCKPNIAQMVAALADAPPGGVVLHCHAGKERTGLAAVLLLSLIGVDEVAIANDHIASDRYLEPLYDAWIAARPPDEREQLRRNLTLDARQIPATLEVIRHAYGDVAGYLSGAGVGDGQIQHVRERLLG